ncbi:MAG TPA: AMP-binding protein [Burkholderiales bacterium]|nr:AMP-binding protein [Burkholderiales bacterium]
MPEVSDRPRTEPANEALSATLLAVIAELLRESEQGGRARAVRLDSSLERDLGIDSLARVELIMRIERAFDLRLPEHLLGTAETPRDLLRAVRAGGARASEPGAQAATPIVQAALGSEELPDEAATLLDVLDWHVAAHPARVHVVLLAEGERGEPMSYAELRGEAGRLAAGFADLGVGAGDTVAIMLPTCREFFGVFFAVVIAGAVPVPIYPPARASDIAEHLRRQSGILNNCLAKLLVTFPEAERFAALLRDQVPTLRSCVTVSQLARPEAPGPRPRRSEDLALLQYTSGSTGNPKGVMLSHANLLANIRAMGQAVAADSHDVFVSWLPLYHDMGLIGAWLGSLYFAFPLVVMPPASFLTRPSRWLWAIHRYRGTLTSAPNFAYELCAARVDERDLAGLDLSSLRIAFNGAEPVSPDTLARFAGRFAAHGFAPSALAPVYGLAECAVGLAFPPLGRGPLVDRVERRPLMLEGVASSARADDADALPFAACGVPLPRHPIRVVDGNGRELPERREGRIEFRGPSATAGYFRNAEATRSLFDGDWLDTGDLGYIAGGEIFPTSRAKDLIIRGGQHVHPYELEAAAGNLEGIRKGCVAVFGVADPVLGTEKVVVLAETRFTDRERLERLREALAELALKLLGAPADDIVLAPPHTVLKTSSGKIRRAASRDAYERGLVSAGRLEAWRQRAGFLWSMVRARLRRAGRTAAERLYAAWLWALFSAFALGTFPALLLPGSARRRRAVRLLLRALLRVSGLPVLVRGLENFPGEPLMVVANHSSYFDAFLLFATLPDGLCFVAKRELAEYPVVGWLLRAYGVRFVERGDTERSVRDSRELSHLAERGESLVFFPEGTFTRAPGLLPFHLGAFVAAAAAGIPVLPVAVRGTRSVLRDGDWLPRRGVIQILAGPLLRPQGQAWSAAVALRNLARAEILAHCGEPDLAAGS